MSKDLFSLLLSEVVLTFTSLWAVVLVKAFKHGYIRYYYTGVVIQHVYQTVMLASAITWTFNRQWAWVQSGYFTLRCLVLLMKIHSYLATNGYLQEVDERATKVEERLRELTNAVGGWDQAMSDARTRREEIDQQDTTPSETPALIKQNSAGYFGQPPAAVALRNRLQNLEVPSGVKHNLSSTSIATDSSSKPVQVSLPIAGPPSHPLVDHPDRDISALAQELSELEVELTSTQKHKTRWPANLTWANYVDYQLLPTLVYEIEYPRTDRIRPMYVLEKTVATFGTFFLLYQYTEHYIMPFIPGPGQTTGQSFVHNLLDLALPFMICYLILFYLIFECICNGFAELSRFADREFYDDWWNSTSFDQYARKWNKPVHTFLLKHVYASTLSYKAVGKASAAFLTFFLSACIHELVMAVVTKKIRPYLFVLQMSQIPLIALGRVPFIKRNKVLGNTVFWAGLMAGFPLLCVAYTAY
ncbi:hypothetical protein FRC17_010375 [Serendipita sp. 399]|nr:hypothetical protein FRC17_010375 [Serendipita sp. 399]